jgi:ribonuclease III
LLRRLLHPIFQSLSPDKELIHQLQFILGFTPRRISLYKCAFMHRSMIENVQENNERLEFLGDAILGAVIAEYLFKKYPLQTEGYLTELRSRIVRRETLNSIALRMGLNKMVQFNQNDRGLGRSHIFGNALEALIGAVYLDKGFPAARHFVLRHMVHLYVDLEHLESTDTNYKNQLLSWAQKNNRTVSFETINEQAEGARRMFTIGIMLDDELIAEGSGFNKKEAGQQAAKKALEVVWKGDSDKQESI